MPQFMYEVSYSEEAWATMVRYPQNRRDIVRPIIERVGGTIEGFWHTFGENDAIVIVDLPDNATAAALAMAASASGAMKSIRTVPLMSMDDGVRAMHKAAEADYLPPSKG